MKTKILAISDSDKHFSVAIEEYIKRLGKNIEIINLKPSKKDNPKEIISQDTDQIISYLDTKYKDFMKMLLTKDGKSYSTEDIVDIINWNHQDSKDTLFVIWWPYGLDEIRLWWHVDKQISFGKITMPHGLVKLVIIEQVYRSMQIINNKSYHY